MARKSSTIEQRQAAEEEERLANKAQAENLRRKTVADRLAWRERALAAGVPKAALPEVTAIRGNIADQAWGEHVGRAYRFAPAFAAAENRPVTGRPPGAPTTAPTGSDNTGGMARAYGQVPMSPAERSRYIAQLTGRRAYDPRETEARYGGKSVIPATGAAGYYGEGGKFLGAAYDETGNLIPMPKGAVGLRGQSAAAPASPAGTLTPIGSGTPVAATATPAAPETYPARTISPIKTDFAPRPSFGGETPNFDITGNNRISFGLPPSGAERVGAAVRRTAGAISDVLTPAVPPDYRVETAPSVPPSERIFDVPGFFRGITGQAAQSAGVSRATAADFTQPTKTEEAKTPTSPPSIEDFAKMDEDYFKKKAYAGF